MKKCFSMRSYKAGVCVKRGLFVMLCLLATIPSLAAIDLSKLPKVVTHDNVKSAGVLKDGVLTIHLELKEGAWHPDADDAAGIPALAVAEEGGPPSIPGPTIRVPEGTRIHASFKNTQVFPVFVFGLDQRPGDSKNAAQINPGETKQFDFLAGKPGTYFYRLSCFAPIPIGGQYPTDTTMNGAFIVDAPGAPTDDKVLVLGNWYTWLVPMDFQHGFHEILTVNGKSWPHTTRLSYALGDTARWRVINPTVSIHPMHLHGAHFRVDSAGDGEKDDIFSSERQRVAVTELMQPGRTMAVTWRPTHSGNWIFHCHLAFHFDPELANAAAKVIGAPESEHAMQHHPSGMAGLIVGVEVKPRPGVTEASARPPQHSLTLTLAKNLPNPETRRQCISMEVRDGAEVMTTGPGTELGPTIVIHRDEPTEITVVNHLDAPTAIHWHGIELESYYDGVPGYGGDSRQVTPPIAPGSSFIVHMNPPRAGTYIYHTHWHDIDQLATGLYGALIVLEPGEKYDPEHDRIFVVSTSSPTVLADNLLVNGVRKPPSMQLRAGEKYRLRFINITPSSDSVVYSLLQDGKRAQWEPLAKDGVDLPAFYRKLVDAKEMFAAGETYDYIFEPAKPGKLTLDTNFALSDVKLPIEVVDTPKVSTMK